MAQHFFHGFDIQTLAGNFRRGFVFRQDLRKASHFTLGFQNGLGLIGACLFEDTLRLTIRPRLDFVGIRFRFTNVLLLVLTRGNGIVKRGLHLFRRTRRLEVDVQQSDTHVVRANRLFQLTLGIATDHGTTFGQNAIHGVFADHAAQRAVGGLTQTVVRAGHAKQIALRIGSAVLHVHLNAHHVFVRGQHDAGSRKFAHRLHVHRLNVIDKGRFPVQARLNQMAELTKTGDHAALGLFNGIETAGRPDNHCRRGNDADNTPAHRSARPLRAIAAAHSALAAAEPAKFFT